MMDFAEFKKFFLYNLIGSLIIAALVAVITVLIGKFNEVSWRVLLTLFMVVIHSLISLVFIWDNERENTFERLSVFINVLFILIVLSFFSSILGIWEVIPGEFVWHIYQTYFVLLFASLHGDILSKALKKENYIDIIIYINYIFMGIVVLMLLPIIYMDDARNVLGDLYYRVLAAMGIIDGTLSILTIIFYRIFMHNHPDTENPLGGYSADAKPSKAEKKGLSIWVWILIIYLIVQIGFPILGFGFWRFFD